MLHTSAHGAPVPSAPSLRRAFATLTIMSENTDAPCPSQPERPRLPFGVVRCADCSPLIMCVTLVIVRERSVECRWPPEAVALRVHRVRFGRRYTLRVLNHNATVQCSGHVNKNDRIHISIVENFLEKILENY